jgi:hypothetical protein
MNEKDSALDSEDYGKDLRSVQGLQRKHEGLERDLAALEDKVSSVKQLWNVVLWWGEMEQFNSMSRESQRSEFSFEDHLPKKRFRDRLFFA